MTALSFSLTFASVPFLNDDARSYQFSRGVGEVEGRSPVRKQQPEGWLWDEVERVLPTEYLQDFTYQQEYPGRNTGSLARHTRFYTDPSDKIRLGDYYYPVGATRWSYYRGLATSSMAKAMLAATQGNKPATFTISSEPISQGIAGKSYTVSTQMYMLPPRPLGELVGDFDGLYLITLVDERYFWQQGPITLHPTFSTTWADLLSQIATYLGIQLSYSSISSAYLTPEPDSHLWSNQEDVALYLDAIAYNIGRVLVRAYDGTYSLMTPEASLAQARANRTDSTGAVIREMGGDCFYSGSKLPVGSLQKSRNILPTAIRVTFPKYVTDSTVPHFAEFRGNWSRWFLDSYNGTYAIDTPITSGGALFSGLSGGPFVSGVGGGHVSGNGTYTIFNTAKALYATDSLATSGTPSNVSGLTALAGQIARDFYTQNGVDGLDEVYLGILNWTPEGLHDIVFSWSVRSRIASTRVIRPEWNSIVRDMQHCTPAVGGGVGYNWVPGMYISSGYTIAGNSGTSLNINITNINFEGEEGEFSLFIPADSNLNMTFEDPNTSLFNIVNNENNQTLATFTTTEFNNINNLTVQLNPGTPVTIVTQDEPDVSIVSMLITEDNTQNVTIVIPQDNSVTLTTQVVNTTNPVVTLTTLDLNNLNLTIHQNVNIVDENNVTLTTFTVNDNNVITTFITGSEHSLAVDDPDEIVSSMFVIDQDTVGATILPDKAVTFTTSDDEDPIVSFTILDIDSTFFSTIANSSLWVVDGTGSLSVSSFLILNGPLEGGYVTQDPVTDVEQTSFFVVDSKPINRIPVNVDANIRGIARPADGRGLLHTIINTGTGTATIYNNDGAATGSDRILTPGGSNLSLAPNGMLFAWYDPVSAMTRVVQGGAGSSGDDEKVKVSSDDTTAGYLNGKLVAGTNITFTENNPGGNETLTIAAGASGVTSRTEGTLTATGSVQGDAAPIVTDSVLVSGADGSKGVILPNTGGAIIAVKNDNPIQTLPVYPHSGASIYSATNVDIGTNNALAIGGFSLFVRISSTIWQQIVSF